MAEQSRLPLRTIRGNVGFVEAPHETPTGKTVASFTLYENKKVNGVEETTKFKCSLWDKDAALIDQIQVGARYMVFGPYEEKTYVNKTTNLPGVEHAISVWEVSRSLRLDAEARPQTEASTSYMSSANSTEDVPF